MSADPTGTIRTLKCLHGTLSLHGIDDVEAFALAIVQRSRLELNHHDREDLIAYLVAECWQLSLRYQPGGVSFSTYAGTTLRGRVVDWQRKRFGRTRWVFKDRVYERPQPQFVSLDDPEHDQLGPALGAWTGDPEADRSPDLLRLLGSRSSTRTRDYETLGLRPPRQLEAELEQAALPRQTRSQVGTGVGTT